jgi:hypothetical protein
VRSFDRSHHPGEHGFSSPGVASAGDPACRAEGLLARSGYPALDRVRCDFSDGVLLLRGQVPSYYLRQLAQEAVAGLPGVRAVRNEVEVLAGEAPPVAPPGRPAGAAR